MRSDRPHSRLTQGIQAMSGAPLQVRFGALGKAPPSRHRWTDTVDSAQPRAPLPGRGYRFDLRVRRKLTRSMVAKITLGTRRESVASDNARTGNVGGRMRLHLSSNTGVVRVASWLESTWSETPARTGSGLGTKIQIGRNTKLDLWANRQGLTKPWPNLLQL